MAAATATPPRFTNKLQGQNVLIFGGTGGVGISTAQAFLEYGANVIITSSRQSKLDSSLAQLKSTNPSVKGFTCDLASSDVEKNLQTLVEQVKSQLGDGGKLNHLIYAAGDRLPTTSIETVTLDFFQKAIQVRGASALLAVKTFLPLLHQSNTTSITITGGSISDKPIPGGWSVLGFIGAGINGMCRQLALDLKPIRVNAVAPGVVDTDLWSDMSEEERTKFYKGMEGMLPTGRVPGGDDVAESYLYLARDRNITGSVVHTNGGAFLV